MLTLIQMVCHAENIDPKNDNSQFAYGENVGWVNAEPLGDGGPGLTVLADRLTGWLWTENVGWISLSCENTGSCGEAAYGVTHDGSGRLDGYGYAENVGWVAFSCQTQGSCDDTPFRVSIDSYGNFKGFAYGENVGWIQFRDDSVAYKVQADWTYSCLVDLESFAKFSIDWMQSGVGLNGDLNGDSLVDVFDLTEFGSEWLLSCPEGWTLH